MKDQDHPHSALPIASLKLPDLATQVAFDPVFSSQKMLVDAETLKLNPSEHQHLITAYQLQAYKTHPLQHAVKDCQRRYERQRRGIGYFTRHDFKSSADYVDYLQPLFVAQCHTCQSKGHSLGSWRALQKLKDLLQF